MQHANIGPEVDGDPGMRPSNSPSVPSTMLTLLLTRSCVMFLPCSVDGSVIVLLLLVSMSIWRCRMVIIVCNSWLLVMVSSICVVVVVVGTFISVNISTALIVPSSLPGLYLGRYACSPHSSGDDWGRLLL